MNSKHHQYVLDHGAGSSESAVVLVHHQGGEAADGLSPKQQQVLQRNALQHRHEQFVLNSKITATQLEGMTQHEQLMLLKQQQEYLIMK